MHARPTALTSARPLTSALTALAGLMGLALSAGCHESDWGKPAPFKAEPAPATWTRPAPKAEAPKPASPEAKQKGVERVWGQSTWPCEGHAACSREAPNDGTFGTTAGGFEFLDPSRVSETEGMFVATQLFEGLVSPARRSGEPVEMGVAESWTVSADSRVWTFKLRENARWSNGRAVTADDFVYAWLRKLDPATGADGVDPLLYIAGAEELNAGKSKDPNTVGVKALDPRTLQVTLRCSVPYWPSYLVSAHHLPVPREAIEAHGRLWDRPEHIVTNGPYHLTELKERDRLVMVRSETYWDKDNVRIPRVVVYHAETETQAMALYESGEVHWARGAVSPNTVAAAMADKRPDFFIDPLLCTYYYLFRVDKPALEDPRVRRAIDLAIDKDTLVKHVTRGMQLPADSIVPPSFEATHGYKRPPTESYDPDLAKRLLAEAGFPNAKGLPELRLIYNTMESHKAVADFVGRQLQENLGVQVKVENMEWKSLLQQLRTKEFQLARLGMCANDTPISFLEQFKSNSPRNDMGWSSPEFDAAFEKARCGSNNEAEYLDNVAAAEKLVVEGRSVAPLYWYTRPYFLAPVVGGFDVHVEDEHLLKYLYFRDIHTPPARHPLGPPTVDSAVTTP